MNYSSLLFNISVKNSSLRNNGSRTFLSSNDELTNTTLRTLIIVVGTVGNLQLFVVVWMDSTLRLGTRLLIMNVAVSAFLVMVVGHVGNLIYTSLHIPGSCPLYAVFFLLGVVANWAEVALALNRLIAVCYPHRYAVFAAPKPGGLLCGATWIIGAVVTAFAGSGIGSYFKEVRTGACTPLLTSAVGRVWILMSVCAPVVICSMITLRIVFDLSKKWRSDAVARQNPPMSRRDLKKRQLVRAMIASAIWNCSSTLPWIIVFDFIAYGVSGFSLLGAILRFLSVAQIAINPYILLMFYGNTRTMRCRPTQMVGSLEQPQQQQQFHCNRSRHSSRPDGAISATAPSSRV